MLLPYFNYDDYNENPSRYFDSLSPEERRSRFDAMEKANDREMARQKSVKDPIGFSPYRNVLDGDEIKSLHKERLHGLRNLRRNK